MTSLVTRAGVVGLIGLTFFASSPTWGAAAPPSDPVHLTVVPDTTDSNQWISVVATGFPKGVRALVQLCGTADSEALERCDVESTVNTLASRSGAITVPFHVNPPESGCPCFVEVVTTEQPATVVVQAGLSVDGADKATIGRLDPTPSSAPVEPVKVVNTEIAAGSWASWFGVGSTRTLSFTMENTADTPVEVGAVELRGHLARATAEPLPSPVVGVLAPGERRTLRVSLHVDPLTWGEYTTTGQVASASSSAPITFDTTMRVAPPWGLFVVGIVTAETLLVLAWRWWQRRTAIDLLIADPALARRVSRAVVAGTVLSRNASGIAESIARRVTGRPRTPH
jgi:hypothetical protein